MSQEFYDCIGEWADRCAALSKELAELKQAHDTLLTEAVWAMTQIKTVFADDGPEVRHAAAFLARPDVREWQARQAATNAPKFQVTYCSQCGGQFGPGDHGYSHCENHRQKETP